MLNRLIRFIILRLVHLYYPHLEIKNRQNLPTKGPIIFVLNHPNGLLDPMLLILSLGQPVSFLAKSTFWNNPVGRRLMQAFETLPVYRSRDESQENSLSSQSTERNEATFSHCRALLRQGKLLALFPEGTTHSKTMLLPLRTGAARIALSAEAEAGWNLGLSVVPVGLWYQNKTRFRSAALIVVGSPFNLADYTNLYATDERQAVRVLTEQIEQHLKAVVLQAENAELLTGIPFIAAWTDPKGPPLTLEQQHQRAALLLTAYQRLQETNPARLEAIAWQARHYAQILNTLGIDNPWSLELAPAQRHQVIWQSLLLLISLPLAAVGIILSYIPYRLAAPLTPYLVGPEDEVAGTGKLIIGSVLVASSFVIEAIICGVLWGVIWGILFLLAAPGLAYIALRWGESWDKVREVITGYWLYWRHRSLIKVLAAQRQALALEVMKAVDESGVRVGDSTNYPI